MTLDADHPGGESPEPPEPSEPDRRRDATPVTGTGTGTGTDDEAVAQQGRTSRRRGGGSAGMLGAAMLAVGEILEPEKTKVEIVQTDDDPLDDDLPFAIDFGDLPPLD